MIFWLIRKRRWPWIVLAIFLVLDWTIAPAIVAWELKFIHDSLNP